MDVFPGEPRRGGHKLAQGKFLAWEKVRDKKTMNPKGRDKMWDFQDCEAPKTLPFFPPPIPRDVQCTELTPSRTELTPPRTIR